MPEIRIVALFGARVLLGQERANIETLAALHERGCAVLCVLRDDDWAELDALQAHIESFGIACRRIPFIDYPVKEWLWHIARRNPGAFIQGNRKLARLLIEFRATHIHAFNAFYVASFWWAVSRSPLPMIYRCGDKPPLHNAFYRAAWRFITRRASHFVADSRFIERVLCEAGVSGERVSVCYAPPPRRTAGAPFALPSAAAAPDAFRFVFAGQIAHGKGVDLLVDAMRSLCDRYPKAHVLVAGRVSGWQGDDWGRALGADVASHASLAKRIHFLGFVESIPELFAQCDVHVAPSRWEEAYGLVVIEAKQAGIPSIVFATGALQELVSSDEDGIVVNDVSAAGLAAAMESYLRDPDRAARHGLAARQSLDTIGVSEFGDFWMRTYTSSLRAV